MRTTSRVNRIKLLSNLGVSRFYLRVERAKDVLAIDLIGEKEWARLERQNNDNLKYYAKRDARKDIEKLGLSDDEIIARVSELGFTYVDGSYTNCPEYFVF